MDILHKVGDVVICANASGYALTTGKEYTVVDVWPENRTDSGFVFPSYVVVRDDFGREATCHHHRFRPWE